MTAPEVKNEALQLKDGLLGIKLDAQKTSLDPNEKKMVDDFLLQTDEEIKGMQSSLKYEDTENLLKVLKLAKPTEGTNERLDAVIRLLEEMQIAEAYAELGDIITSEVGPDMLMNQLEGTLIYSGFLQNLTQEQWEDAFKGAKTPEEKRDLAVIFRMKDKKYSRLNNSFDKTRYDADTEVYQQALAGVELNKQEELSSLYLSIKESLAPIYDDLVRSSRVTHQNLSAEQNLGDDVYGEGGDRRLDANRDKRSDENIAVADLLVADRPSREAVRKLNEASNKKVILSLLKEATKTNAPEWSDITRQFRGYYERGDGYLDSSYASDLAIFRDLYNNHKEEIQKLSDHEDMLKFVKKIKDWDTMINVLEYVVRNLDSSEWNSFKQKMEKGELTKDDIKSHPEIMKLYGKKRFLRSETSHVVKILNNASLENINKIIALKKNNIDLREVYNQTTLLDVNGVETNDGNMLNKNPLLFLCDFSADGKLNRGQEGVANGHRWSEQQMYSTFISVADTKENNGVKEIVNGQQTGDVIRGFKMLLKNKYSQEVLDAELPDQLLDHNSVEANQETNQPAQKGGLDLLADFMKKHPEAVSYYHHELDSFSYIYSASLQELVTKRGLEGLLTKEDLRASNELNQLTDENSRWFLSQIEAYPKDSEERKFFESMTDAEKLQNIKNMNKVLNATLGIFGAHFNDAPQITQKDLDKNTNFKINWFRDNNGIHPRITLGFDVEKIAKAYYHEDGSKIGEVVNEFKGFIPYIDVPIVNGTLTQDLNVDKVKNQNIHNLTAVHQFYARLGFNIGVHFLKQGEDGIIYNNDPTEWFTAGIEAGLGVKKNYRESIELKGQTLGKVLDTIFSTKNGVDFKEYYTDGVFDKEKLKADLQKRFKGDKAVERYLEENQYEMERIVSEVVDRLDAMASQLPNFENGNEESKYYKNMNTVLKAMLRSVVENIKNEDKESLNGDTKLTGIGGFAGFGIGKHSWALTFGVEATISHFKMLYAPDSEKYQYMDESLKSGADVFPFEGNTSNGEGIESSVRKLLDRSTITGLKVEVTDDGLLTIEATPETMKKYFEKGEGSITDLFNIYVDPDQITNFKLEKNKITLGNVKDLSLVTRSYFDTFSTYLFIGGRGVDGCKNNKVRFDENQPNRFANDPKDKFNIIGRVETRTDKVDLGGNEGYPLDEETIRKVSKLDNTHSRQYSLFLKAMNEGNIDDAKSQLESILQGSGVELSLPNSEIGKINVLNAFKAAFAFDDRVHEESTYKSVISKRRDVFGRLNIDLNQDDISEMVDLRNSLIDKEGLNVGYDSQNTNKNILGFTAFYARHAKGENVRGFSLTSLGATNIFGGAENYKQLDNQKIVEWIQKKIQLNDNDGTTSQSPEGKQVYKQIATTLEEKLKTEFGITDLSFFENNQNKFVDAMLWPNEYDGVEDGFVNIGDGIKVRLNKEFVFYLLGECANESFGLNLGNIEIKRDLGHQLNLSYGGDALTKTENIRENQGAIKISVGTLTRKSNSSQTNKSESLPNNDGTPIDQGESLPEGDATVIGDGVNDSL